MQLTERAKRVGRAAVAARYRSEKERKAITSGKQNVKDATLAAQLMLPALTICEIALDIAPRHTRRHSPRRVVEITA